MDESEITTPAEALAALKAGNERFLSGNTLKQDFKLPGRQQVSPSTYSAFLS